VALDSSEGFGFVVSVVVVALSTLMLPGPSTLNV